MNDDNLLTITDSAGRSLVLERQDDGVSVLLGEGACAQVAEFMRGGAA